MESILVLHGANLNMFGKRDPKFYGTETLAQINAKLTELGDILGMQVECFQTNCEGAFIDKIHAAHELNMQGLIVNAGAWSHSSYAIMDALAILTVPVVEVHMSNIHAREAFRRVSLISAVASGSIAGFGLESYLLGLRALAGLVRREDPDIV